MDKPTDPILRIADTPAVENLGKGRRRKRRKNVQRLTPEEMDVEIRRVQIENSGLAIAPGTEPEADGGA